MVTVLAPEPLAMLTVPLEGVRLVVISAMLTTVPVPSGLLMSGLVAGKLFSLAIGTNPPTSSTKSMMRASMAAVVAMDASEPVHAIPLLMVSLESCRKYRRSDADVV